MSTRESPSGPTAAKTTDSFTQENPRIKQLDTVPKAMESNVYRTDYGTEGTEGISSL